MASGLRIRVAVVGSTSCCRIRVDTSVEEGAARLQLIADAAAKLDVVMPQGGAGDVVMYVCRAPAVRVMRIGVVFGKKIRACGAQL